MTRLIDADKLYPDCLTKEGNLAISQSQIANAPTVEYPEAITIKCDTEEDKQKLLSALRNASARLEVHVEEERPYGEWIEHKESLNGSFMQEVTDRSCWR